ncbi:MAG TPA: alternate-type signal peptide domain-containing protein, partial [Microbacteriaceae bacterium]|nr:alternate-type signal peptide domain-containing protein [Microbacteriaceae bacterium]
MNKNLKGAVAIGAGVLLLLGGGGTLALWNANTTVTAGSVTSGVLNFDTTTADGTWYHYDSSITDIADYATASPSLVVDTSTYLVVPEDKLIFISDGVELTATGGELYFSFDTNVTGTGDTAGYTTSAVTPTVISGSLPATVTTGTFLPTPSATATVYGGTDVDSAATLALSFVVTFNASGTANQDDTINFDTATISVQQVIK